MIVKTNNTAYLRFQLKWSDGTDIDIKKVTGIRFSLVLPNDNTVTISDLGYDKLQNQVWVRIDADHIDTEGTYKGNLSVITSQMQLVTTGLIDIFEAKDNGAECRAYLTLAVQAVETPINQGQGYSPKLIDKEWYVFDDDKHVYVPTGQVIGVTQQQFTELAAEFEKQFAEKSAEWDAEVARKVGDIKVLQNRTYDMQSNILSNLLSTNVSVTCDFSIMERGGMSIKDDGTYSKFDTSGQLNNRIRLQCEAVHLSAGSKLSITNKSARLFVGGIYDDGTPIEKGWKVEGKIADYVCEKDGTYVIIMTYVGIIEFDAEHKAEDLALMLTISDEKTLRSIKTSHDVYISSDTNYANEIQQWAISKNNAKRITPSGDSINVVEGTSIYVAMANATYQIALRVFNKEGELTKDTGWTSSSTYTTKEDDCSFNIWMRRKDDGLISDSDVNNAVSSLEISYTGFKETYKGVVPTVGAMMAIMKEVTSRYCFRKSIRNIAHQGYSSKQSYGNSRLSAYIEASKMGFDYGECDIQWTLDGHAVCCHDSSFVDSVTGETVIIGSNTLQDLKSYNYYGEHIASFEDVVSTVKRLGLGLYVDKVTFSDQQKWNYLFKIVHKYAMQDKTVWLCIPYEAIVSQYPRSRFCVTYQNELTQNIINNLNDYAAQNPECTVSANFNASKVSVTDIINAYDKLSPKVGVEVWTIDDIKTYMSYLPHVSGITSNKISEFTIQYYPTA